MREFVYDMTHPGQFLRRAWEGRNNPLAMAVMWLALANVSLALILLILR